MEKSRAVERATWEALRWYRQVKNGNRGVAREAEGLERNIAVKVLHGVHCVGLSYLPSCAELLCAVIALTVV
jgi:hypothetical protein